MVDTCSFSLVSYLLVNIVSTTLELLIEELKSQSVTLFPFYCFPFPPMNSLKIIFMFIENVATSDLKQPKTDTTSEAFNSLAKWSLDQEVKP